MPVSVVDWLLLLLLLHFTFSALTLLVGWQKGHLSCKKLEWWDAGMVICLGRSADLHMAQLMPLPLNISSSSKSRLVIPSWFYVSGGRNMVVVVLLHYVCLTASFP